ncbi:hypothetical protein ACLOJK_028571 [Asimina triloba]
MAAGDESSGEGVVDRSKPLERTAITTRFQIQQRRAAACLQPATPSSPIQTRQHPSSPPHLRPAPSVADQSTVHPPICVGEQLHPMTPSSIWPPADGPDPSPPEPAARPFCIIDDRQPQPHLLLHLPRLWHPHPKNPKSQRPSIHHAHGQPSTHLPPRSSTDRRPRASHPSRGPLTSRPSDEDIAPARNPATATRPIFHRLHCTCNARSSMAHLHPSDPDPTASNA